MTKELKIVFLDAGTIGKDVSLDPISSLGKLTTYQTTAPEEIVSRAAGCDVLIVNKIKIGRKEIDAMPGLRLICEAATGTDNIEVEYATLKGIPVKNVRAYSTESVVQLTFTILLAAAGQIDYFDNAVKSGSYSKSNCFTDVSRAFLELNGKRYGIIGLGNIGGRVAEIAKAFGMEVVYYPTSGKPHSEKYPAVYLDEMMRTCDVISIHAPMNDKTRNLITYDKLALMKPTAYLLNLGRGGIINEEDLVRALNDNKLAGAGIDVFTKEPLPAESPYLKLNDMSKIVLTPHIGWCSREARMRLVEGIASNIRGLI
jgi:lactate dehydrogenase-like 2-hydroxyacid dehydrogenase